MCFSGEFVIRPSPGRLCEHSASRNDFEVGGAISPEVLIRKTALTAPSQAVIESPNFSFKVTCGIQRVEVSYFVCKYREKGGPTRSMGYLHRKKDWVSGAENTLLLPLAGGPTAVFQSPILATSLDESYSGRLLMRVHFRSKWAVFQFCSFPSMLVSSSCFRSALQRSFISCHSRYGTPFGVVSSFCEWWLENSILRSFHKQLVFTVRVRTIF